MRDDQSRQVVVAVNKEKRKLSMASALIWKDGMVTEGNLRTSLHWTNHTRLGQIQEEKLSWLAGVRLRRRRRNRKFSLLRGDSLGCAALPDTDRLRSNMKVSDPEWTSLPCRPWLCRLNTKVGRILC